MVAGCRGVFSCLCVGQYLPVILIGGMAVYLGSCYEPVDPTGLNGVDQPSILHGCSGAAPNPHTQSHGKYKYVELFVEVVLNRRKVNCCRSVYIVYVYCVIRSRSNLDAIIDSFAYIQ